MREDDAEALTRRRAETDSRAREDKQSLGVNWKKMKWWV